MITHALIEDTVLMPRKVSYHCANSAIFRPEARRHRCSGVADVWLVACGYAQSKVCTSCAEDAVPQLRVLDPRSNWTTAPIFHDDPSLPEQGKPRHNHKEGVS